MTEKRRTGTLLFCERRRLPRPVDIPLSVFLAACAASTPFLWAQSAQIVPRLLVVTCMGLVPVLMLSMHSTLRIDDEKIVLSLFPVWRRTIEVTDVVAVQPRRIQARDMQGLGLRMTTDGTLGLVMRGHDAVEITVSDGKRYVLGTARRAELLRVLAAKCRGRR